MLSFKRLLAIAFLVGLAPALGGCLTLSTQQSADLANAAVVTCNGAQIAAAASVAITADVNAPPQTQKDAATAVALTKDACAAIVKLPTVIDTAPNPIVAPLAAAPVTASQVTAPAVTTAETPAS